MTSKIKYPETKSKISAAFRKLRKHGLLCKQDFLCCSSCATSELDSLFKAAAEGTYKGAVYYHNQDLERFNEGGKMTLRYVSENDLDETTKQIGDLVAYRCKAAGLTVVWNGKVNTAIEVS